MNVVLILLVAVVAVHSANVRMCGQKIVHAVRNVCAGEQFCGEEDVEDNQEAISLITRCCIHRCSYREIKAACCKLRPLYEEEDVARPFNSNSRDFYELAMAQRR
ncbi:unnamed protein product [Caenorhabditis auriculariae]|uniref:Uncharacterized protein n=1 Tax=Caenorhabditis auriculariae TaxID=2777116 RepID=A0A8S1H2V0_9PELO|nr:unnamed protein product [Caenorhabditis auriculariae]